MNLLNAEKETALLLASYYGHLDLVELLLEHGADVKAGPSVNGLCCVGAAAQMGHTSVVRRLLKEGNNIIDGLGNICCVPLKQVCRSTSFSVC